MTIKRKTIQRIIAIILVITMLPLSDYSISLSAY